MNTTAPVLNAEAAKKEDGMQSAMVTSANVATGGKKVKRKNVNAQSANLRTTKNCTPNLRRTMGGGDLTVSYRPRVCDGCEFCIGTYCDRDEMDCKCPKCKPEMYGWEVVASANRDNCKKLAELWDKLNWQGYKMDDFESGMLQCSGREKKTYIPTT
jgi:hypothetical protein